MNTLVTGASGFAGSYVLKELRKQGHKALGISRSGKNSRICDVTNHKALHSLIKEIQPDGIIHLAALGSIEASEKNPGLARETSVTGTKNLFTACLETSITPKIVIISSSNVYGIQKNQPISETAKVQATNPYASVRIEQEQVAKKLAEENNLHLIILRSFNHTGPGQPQNFLVSSIAKQIATVEKGLQDSLLLGNLQTKRDFTDVRDIAKAYVLAMKKAKPGVYNVCSGNAYSAQSLVGIFEKMLKKKFTIKQKPSLLRNSDIEELRGDPHKFIQATGWKPTIPMQQTLSDMLDYWRNYK